MTVQEFIKNFFSGVSKIYKDIELNPAPCNTQHDIAIDHLARTFIRGTPYTAAISDNNQRLIISYPNNKNVKLLKKNEKQTSEKLLQYFFQIKEILDKYSQDVNEEDTNLALLKTLNEYNVFAIRFINKQNAQYKQRILEGDSESSNDDNSFTNFWSDISSGPPSFENHQEVAQIVNFIIGVNKMNFKEICDKVTPQILYCNSLYPNLTKSTELPSNMYEDDAAHVEAIGLSRLQPKEGQYLVGLARDTTEDKHKENSGYIDHLNQTAQNWGCCQCCAIEFNVLGTKGIMVSRTRDILNNFPNSDYNFSKNIYPLYLTEFATAVLGKLQEQANSLGLKTYTEFLNRFIEDYDPNNLKIPLLNKLISDFINPEVLSTSAETSTESSSSNNSKVTTKNKHDLLEELGIHFAEENNGPDFLSSNTQTTSQEDCILM